MLNTIRKLIEAFKGEGMIRCPHCDGWMQSLTCEDTIMTCSKGDAFDVSELILMGLIVE